VPHARLLHGIGMPDGENLNNEGDHDDIGKLVTARLSAPFRRLVHRHEIVKGMHLPVRLKISLEKIVIKHSPDMGVVVGSLFLEIRRSRRTLRSSSNVLAV